MIQTMFDTLSDKCAGMTQIQIKSLFKVKELVELDRITQTHSKYSDQVNI